MQVIEEKVKMYQAKDGTKFKERFECETYEKGIPYGNYYASLSETREFDVNEKHLKLIKRSNIKWGFHKDGYNDGHFYQDLVRPYGNSHWVKDIALILDIKEDCFNPDDEDDKWFSDKLEYYLACCHIDMKILIEILCQNLSIQKGTYKREDLYGGKWSLVAC